MALIKCPECGRMISEFADYCISCGCPMKKIKELISKPNIKTPNTKKTKTKKGKYIELTRNIFYNDLSVTNKLYVSSFWKAFKTKQPDYYIKNHVHSIEFVTDDSVKPAFFFEEIKGELCVTYSISSILKARTTMRYKPSDTTNIVGFANALVENKVYKDAGIKESKNKKASTQSENKQTSLSKPPFSSTLSKEEKESLSTFRAMIKESYYGIEENDYQSLYAFKQRDKDFNMFWFARNDKELVFKYRSNIQTKDDDIKVVPVLKYSPEWLFKIVTSVMSKNENSPTKKKQLLPINELIICAMKGRKMPVSKYSSLAKEIAEYTTSYIYFKYKDIKSFKTREEFDTYKNRYYDYTYHGRPFSFKNFYEDDAVYVFEYFIASRLVGLIQKYESIFGKIIENVDTVLESYYELITSGEDAYKSILGVNSNIQYVSYDLFEEERDKYYQ